MTSPQLGAYTFLPWVQGGVARSITAPDDPGVALTARVRLPVTRARRRRRRRAGDRAPVRSGRHHRARAGADRALRPAAGHHPLRGRLHAAGPVRARGSAVAVHAGRAGRHEDAAAALAGARDVRRQDGVRLEPNPGGPLPVLEIAAPAGRPPSCPTSSSRGRGRTRRSRGSAPERVPSTCSPRTPDGRARALICPRHLEPDTAYLACLVPAFKAGVKAGLGDPVTAEDEAKLEPAWPPAPPNRVRLPVYHAWEFATGPAGSFETLVRRLHPSPLDPASSLPPKLDLNAAGSGLPAGGVIGIQSALRVPGPDALPPWPDAQRAPFQTALERTLTNAPPDVLAPPIYGQLQAGASALPATGAPPAWLRELNLDPRLRIAAAAGARVVQERQEQLMARAWAQAGARNEANALLRGAQLARELGTVVLERHLTPLSPSGLLAITQPAHARRSSPSADVERSCARAACPRRRVRRDAPARQPAGPARAARRAAAQLNVLAAVDQVAMRPAPAAPIGMVMMATPRPPPPAPTHGRRCRRQGCASSCSCGSRPRPPCSRARWRASERPPARGRGPTRSRRSRPARASRADVRRPAQGRAVAAAAGRREGGGRQRRAAGDVAARDRSVHGRPQPRDEPRAAVARVPGR